MTYPPGWYPSPQYPGSMQYWNGMEWTPQVRSMSDHDNYGPSTQSGGGIAVDKTGLTKIIAAILLMKGLVLLAFTIPSVVDQLAPDSGQTVTTGKVVEINLNTMRRNDGSPGRVDKCKPTATFTVDGTQYEAKTPYYEYPCKWEVGDSAEVTYDPSRPESTAVIGKADSGAMFGVWLFLGIGSIMTLAGASIMALAFRRRKVLS